MTNEAVSEDIFLTVNQCKRAVVAAMLANKPVALWGESGVGKSTVIREVCDKLGFEYFDFRMSDKDPTDAGGVPIPDVENGTLKYAVTNMIPWDHVVGERKAALVLDEFDRAEPALQNMALQLVLDRCVNGHKLGQNVVIILAGNGTSDTYTTPLSEAAARRMIHLYVTRAGAKGLASYEAHAEEKEINPHHVGFARFCNETWSVGADQIQFEELGRPCPRTFDMAGVVYDTLKEIEGRKQFKTDDLYVPLVAGCVGKAAAYAYIGWRNMCETAPNPKDVLANPKKADIPVEAGVLYALVASLTDCAEDYDTAERVTAFLVRVSDLANQQEIAAMGFRRMIKKLPEAATVPEHVAWAERNKSLLR